MTLHQESGSGVPSRTACGKPERRLKFGWCGACYQRWYKAGRPESGPPPRRETVLEVWRGASVPPAMEKISDLGAGIAAEHLVCADLLLQGYRAFMSDQSCPYDVAVDLGRLVRIQVKSTRGPRATPGRAIRTPAYQFRIRMGGTRRSYTEGSFEMLALVALDIRVVAYLPPSFQRQSVFLYPSDCNAGKKFEDFPFLKAVAELGLLA